VTYALIVLPFALATLVVVLVSARRPAFGRRMAASGISAAVLVALTAVFDNVMIAAGLFSYPPEHLSGLRVGLAPVEDFSYAVCAAFLVPAVFALLPARTRIEEPA
jgi:lycopene cyclase domain-containing protein